MTRIQAQREVKKRWGARGYWRVMNELSSPERRAKAQEAVNAARAAKIELETEILRREEAAGIPALREQVKALARTIRETALGDADHFKFKIGFIDNVIGAFNVIGEGDTWEEAFAAADAKRKSV